VRSDVISMFPTLVWRLEVDGAVREAIRTKGLAALARLRQDLPSLAPGEGWQSIQTLHELEEFRELVTSARQAVAGILRFLSIGYDAVELTGCWATVLAPGASHRIHRHPNNFLSGVYYLQTCAGADTINFHDPRAHTGIIRPPVTALTDVNTDQVVLRVHDGTLLVFPSWLEHSVDANAGERERISISFNLMFSSFTEQLAKPLWAASAEIDQTRPG
jgi:uncharacterized protein (TIGR02466 family)